MAKSCLNKAQELFWELIIFGSHSFFFDGPQVKNAKLHNDAPVISMSLHIQ